DPITTATAAVAKAHPAFYVGEAGSASSAKALNKMFSDQLKNAGTRSIPLTVIILLLVFGSIVAAGVPLLLALTAVAGTTGLPALLSRLADKVEKGRIPWLGRLRRPSGENRVWAKILTPALRHPVISALAAAAVLLTMAVPVLHMHTAQSGLNALPRSAPTVEPLNRLQE